MNSDPTPIPERESEQESVISNSDNLEAPAAEEDVNSAEVLELSEEPGLTDDSLTEQPDFAPVKADSKPEPTEAAPLQTEVEQLTERLSQLQNQEQSLQERVAMLQAEIESLQDQLSQTQSAMGRLVQEGLSELEQRKKKLQITVEQLERRSERIRAEMRTSFAGVSQDLAIRVQGFKDYLVGSLQDLAAAAEQLELVPEPTEVPRSAEEAVSSSRETSRTPKFAEQGFQEQVRQIRRTLDQYRTMPDYYGPPWQLRRTFEPIHAERVSNWFFTQGGRGALRSMGSRLQNILVAAAVISVLRSMYSDRLRTLVLANSPERLGEWRRGLQDCLGITRGDFGPDQGVVLFEAPEVVAQKAERLIQDGLLPLIIIDESENTINLSMLQFPLWLAFAVDPDAAPAMIY